MRVLPWPATWATSIFVVYREQGMLRAIERATRQPIEPMTLPSVAAVNDQRIAKFKEKIGKALESADLATFRGVIERAKLRPRVLLPPEEVPVEVRIEQILAMLSETEACGFEDLFSQDDTRRALIVTFLALLEMIRLKLIRVFQAAAFGPIRVYKRARPADAPTPIGDPLGPAGETHK